MLRCSPSVSHPSLEKFDVLLKQAIQRIINSDLSDLQWIQASLPVRDGGLGVRRVPSLALPAFLAYAASTQSLQDDILTDCVQSESDFLPSYLAVAVGLRLGLDLCIPHQCQCGSPVDARRLHSFVCRSTPGRSARHHARRSNTRPMADRQVFMLGRDGHMPSGRIIRHWVRPRGRCCSGKICQHWKRIPLCAHRGRNLGPDEHAGMQTVCQSGKKGLLGVRR